MKIRELTAEFAKFDPEAEVFIEDADTCWTMPIHVKQEGKTVFLFGEYHEAIRE